MSTPAYPARSTRKAVFIDKDGTLIENVPYNADPALLRFMPGALAALSTLAEAGFELLIASNQSGLALGKFSAQQFDLLREALARRVREEAGVDLLDFVFCPHAPGAGCACRKPAPGLLLDAATRHGLDLPASWMIGDTLDDVEAGRRAGCRTVLYDAGGETLWERSPLRYAHYRTADWTRLAERIVGARAPRADRPRPLETVEAVE